MANEFDVTKEKVEELFKTGKDKAEELLKDDGKVEELLQKLEAKLKQVPQVGNELGSVPLLMSLLRSYIKKEYTEIPKKSIISVVIALVYFVSPVDLIPDFIPGVGYLDDVAVIGFCLNSAAADLEGYEKWREENGLLKTEIPKADGPDIFDTVKAKAAGVFGKKK